MVKVSKVSVVPCDTYEEKMVYEAIKQTFKNLGGVSKFVKKGQTVLLKPNFLGRSKREKVVITDPAMIYGVGKVLKEAGAKILIGDSPGVGTTKSVAESNGSDKVCKRLGIKIVEFDKTKEVQVKNWKKQKKFLLPKVLDKVDVIINMPRMKTHSLCIFTGAVKNLYGLNSGITKGRYHLKFIMKEEFGEMLVDLLSTVKLNLNIMDGVIAMEGNGPGNGDPRPVGCILASVDPVAVDTVACDIIGIPPKKVDYLPMAQKRGLGNMDVKIVGEDPTSFKVEDFKYHLHTHGIAKMIPKWAYVGLRNNLISIPHIKENCIGCRKCEKICPAKAIKMVDKKSNINYSKCIRCYCCHEICPVDAIDLQRPKFLKSLMWLRDTFKKKK